MCKYIIKEELISNDIFQNMEWCAPPKSGSLSIAYFLLPTYMIGILKCYNYSNFRVTPESS